MKKGFSLYCDGLRLAAALAVLFAHASTKRLSGGFLYQLQVLAHPAVIVFFVLSGFVIAFVTDTREKTLAPYAASRLSRLYSVVIPAFVLTVLADHIGIARDPSIYYLDRQTFPAMRLGLGLLFLTQSWQLNTELLSNDAFWSLPYEFWYYVIFGAAVILRGKVRIWVVVAASLIAGPKILLLFPIWLFGAGAYYLSKMNARVPAALLLGASLVVIPIAFWLRVSGIFETHYVKSLPPGFSIADFFLGFGIALNLWAMSQFDPPLHPFKKIIKTGADLSFALYLFHLPLLYCLSAYLPRSLDTNIRGLILLAATMALVWVASQGTERAKVASKHWLLVRFSSHVPQPHSA